VSSTGVFSGGTYTIGPTSGTSTGETLQYTGHGITDVTSGTSLTLNPGGAIKAGSTSALTGLTSVEGTLNLNDGVTHAVTPSGGTLTISKGSSAQGLNLSDGAGSNTTLSVTGNVNNSNQFTTGFSGGSNMVNVSGSFTNNSGASLIEYGTNDVVNIASLTNSGTVAIDPAATLDVTGSGTLTNSAAINMGSPTGGGTLRIGGASVSLSGNGKVTLSNNANNSIIGAAATDTLTNVNNTIQGAGNIGGGQMGFVNQGTVLANQSTPLIIDPSSAGFNNTGTLNVSGGDVMHVLGGPFTNFSGGTLKGGTYNVTGTLEIDELGSSGGEIVTDAANIILNGTSSRFVDAGGKSAVTNLATIATGGGFTINGGQNFTTVGNFTNNGSLTVGSGTKFVVPAGKSLTNFSGTTLTGGTYNVGGTLQFGAAGTSLVTNAANITLSGTNAKIIDSSGGNILTAFATNNAGASFGIGGGQNFTTVGNFTDNGTLTVGSGSKFDVNGNLTNFNSTTHTLTSGTYSVTGTLQFNGANIVTNAANLTLTGISSQIINQTGGNGLASFATNASSGKFTVAGGRLLSTAGAFTNNGSLTVTGSGSGFTTGGNLTNTGTLTIGSGSAFTVGGTGLFTQTAGTTTDDGSLTLNASGTLSLNGGSLLGKGTITGAAVTSSGVISPGDSLTQTGILSDSGKYTQASGGTLGISIGGTTAGTSFDQLNVTKSAGLNGSLTVNLINGFTPALGSTFKIMNFASETGTFANCNGRSGGTTCPINGSEHFTITYQPTDVLLTVVSGAAPIPGQFSTASPLGASYRAVGANGFGLHGRGGLSSFPPQSPRVFVAGALGSPLVSESALGSEVQARVGTAHTRNFVDFSSSARFGQATPAGLASGAKVSAPSVRSMVGLQKGPSAYLGGSVLGAAKLASMDYVSRRDTLNRIEPFIPTRNLSVRGATHFFISTGGPGTIHNRINPAGAAVKGPRMMGPKSMEYHLDVLSLLGASRKEALRGLLGQPGNPNGDSLGYFTFSGIR